LFLYASILIKRGKFLKTFLMATSFKVVYIPCELSAPMKEWDVAIPEGEEIQCLTDRLKKHFSISGGSASKASERDQMREQMKKSVPEGTDIDNGLMAKVMEMGSLVDCVPLVNNTKEAAYIGINLYVDDRGTPKGLPLNQRATQIAQQCHRMVNVMGDAFIGKIFDNEDDFTRMDFSLADLNGDAAWMKMAGMQGKKSGGQGAAEKLRMEMANTASSSSSVKKSSPKAIKAAKPKKAKKEPAEVLPPLAAGFKKAGNEHFVAKRFNEAVAQYTKAIAEVPTSHVLYSNRSAAYLGMEDWANAASDANNSLQLKPTFIKGYFRLAKAHIGNKNVQAAYMAVQGGLNLDAGNKDLKGLLATLKGLIAQAGGGAGAEAGAGENAAAKVEPVPFTTAPCEGEDGKSMATFTVPEKLVPLMVKREVAARGSRFELAAGDAPGTVTTTFISPMPELTAGAIAQRLAVRIQDPNPPGAEECCVM
jgi:hypothetical protein